MSLIYKVYKGFEDH